MTNWSGFAKWLVPSLVLGLVGCGVEGEFLDAEESAESQDLGTASGTDAGVPTIRVANVDDLVRAVNTGAVGDTVILAPGTYLLTASLVPKAKMVIKGSGMTSTILQPAASWNPGTTGLPDNAVDNTSAVQSAYLFNLGGNDDIKVSDMTLDGLDQLHGTFYGNDADRSQLFNLFIKDFLWSGIRTWRTTGALIHDCVFEDAGGRFGDTTGGGLYLTWVADSQFFNNLFSKSANATRDYYGIKIRETRRCRMHHNTIKISGFSIECPHENDADTEIDHNYLAGTISIPKYSGGAVPASGVTFHIHHNVFRTTYSLEWARRAAEVDHNLFDFSTAKDGGNLISSWTNLSEGGTRFHDNLIKNPGRGVFWSQNPYNNFQFYNNHVITNTTVTPRTEGLFGLNTNTTFSTFVIKDNIFECVGQSRGLFRNSASYASVVSNNTLINVVDSGKYPNPDTRAKRGPLEPLRFTCGANDAYDVDGWTLTEVVRPTADSHVRGGSHANRNHGLEGVLATKDSSNGSYDRIAYVKFAVPSSVGSAILTLTVSSLNATGKTIYVYGTTDGWTETGITWNNKPAAGSLLGQAVARTANETLSFDVTNYVAAEKAADGVASFQIRQNGGEALINFVSREATSGALPPVLELAP